MRHEVNGAQSPKSTCTIPPIALSPSAGGGCLFPACLQAADAAPVLAFKKPKCSPEDRFKSVKLLKCSFLQYSPIALAYQMFVFCHRTALTVFLPTDTTFPFTVPSVPQSVLIFSLLLFAFFGSIFHGISLSTPRNLPFRAILNTLLWSTNQPISLLIRLLGSLSSLSYFLYWRMVILSSQRLLSSAAKILDYILLHLLETNTPSIFHNYFTKLNT